MGDSSWFDWSGFGGDWNEAVAGADYTPTVTPDASAFSGFDWSGGLGGGGDNSGFFSNWNFDDMAISMPEWTGYVPDTFFPDPGGGYMWDTTSGALVAPGGGNLPAGYGVTLPGQQQDYTKLPTNLPGTGRGEYVTTTGEMGQPGGPGVYDALSGGLNSVNKILNTPLGRTGAAGLVGIGGLIASQLAAKSGGSYQPSPITQAGQAAWLNALNNGAAGNFQNAIQQGAAGQALLGQQVAGRVGREMAAEEAAAPAEAAIRAAAYPQVAGLMTPGAAPVLNDPVRQGLNKMLMDVLSGNASGVGPMTTQRQQREEQELRNRLFQQEGRDYETTTAGIQALNALKQRHNNESYTERLATINAINAPEQSRYQFETVTPTNLLASQESIRRGNLQDAAGMTQFGIRGVGQNQQVLSNLSPNALIGGNPDQAAQINYGTTNQRNSSLAQGIGAVAGTIAGSIGQRPSAMDAYFDRLYGNTSGFTSAA